MLPPHLTDALRDPAMAATFLRNDAAALVHGDCRNVLSWLPAQSIDAIVTDPPYEIDFAKRDWDRTGIAFDVALWRNALQVLRPGGYLVAFGATRTYHRMAVAIEDAGFQIRDSLHWITGQGLPRGERLKPAHEPIVLARKGSVNRGQLDLVSTRPGRGSSPTNLLLDESAAAGLDEQSGDRNTAFGKSTLGIPSLLRMGKTIRQGRSYKDRGGASRFFNVFKYAPKVTRGRVHETEKPVAVMEWLVRLAARPGQVVLDPFMGSGTTGVASRAFGCNFIGIEQNQRHFDTAVGRVTGES